MTTSLHMVGARAIAMTNGIEERAKATYAGGKAYSIVTDQLGTPTEAYNAEGEEVWSRRLDMNGNILEENYDLYAPYSEQILIPFLFQGQYYDHETELAYNRFRYYSPELGRYISEDPIRFAGGTTALHCYIENPNNSIDLFGLKKTYSEGEGEYGNVKGHHIHAKVAFKDNVGYDPNKGYSIGQGYMDSRGWSHQQMTNKQRVLFDELAKSGRPNTLKEHNRIAVEALKAGGASETEARQLVAKSVWNLRSQGVSAPTHIPWN